MDFTLHVLGNRSKMTVYLDEAYEENNQETTDILFVIDGEVSCYLDGSWKTYSRGHFLILNRFENYKIRKETPQNLYLIIEISDVLLQQSISIDNVKFSCNSLDSPENPSYDQVRETLYRIFELILLNEYRANFLIYSSIYKLLNLLISHYAIQTQFGNQRDVKNREIIKYIYLHYTESLTLPEIAEYFFMEAGYFSKYFKKQFGINYKDYLVDVRLSFAERDLVGTDHNIARVALDNGFSNISSFNRAFKGAHQVSPSVFREQNKVALGTSPHSPSFSYDLLNRRYEKIKRSDQGYQKQDRSSIHLDVFKNHDRVVPIWSKILNVGSAIDLLNDSLKKHLKILQSEISFEYARIWMLFAQDLFVDWKESEIKNFDRYNEIFDTLIDLDLKPWIVMNKYVANQQRFADIEHFSTMNWNKMFHCFIQHMVDRYGLKRVEEWHFEVILENIHSQEEINQFGEIYGVVRSLLKKLSPKIKLGGAGFLGAPETDQVLQKIGFEDFDFYSMVIYPYVRKISKEERDYQRITNPDHVCSQVKRMRSLLENYPKKPFYVSEWNMTVSNHNLINDSQFMGAYLLKNVFDMLGQVDGAGYWGGADINNILVNDTAFLTGATGLLNKFGIPKTVFHAMRFLEEIKNREMLEIGSNYIITRDYNEIHILCYHYYHPNQLYYLKKENSIQPSDIDKFFGKKTIFPTFTIHSIPSGTYDVRFFTCDTHNGSIFDLWKEFNFSNTLRSSDQNYLAQKNTPHLLYYQEEVAGASITVTKALDTNAFCIIHILERTKID